MAGMKVNFNNLRRKAGHALASLTETLNKNIDKDGTIQLSVDDIQDAMTSLRMMVTGIMCVYESGNPHFSDLGSETDSIPHFNPEPDEMPAMKDRNEDW